jgi:serine/threonine protein kinase
MRLSSVLSILVQAVAGLMHLHSLGILHRDLRAANLLLDALDPLHARVADFGVSHLLSAFAAGLRATDLTAGEVPTVLWGNAAMQVCDCTWSTRLAHASHAGASLIVASPLLQPSSRSGAPRRCALALLVEGPQPPPPATCTWWAAWRTSC